MKIRPRELDFVSLVEPLGCELTAGLIAFIALLLTILPEKSENGLAIHVQRLGSKLFPSEKHLRRSRLD
jgi:hypothetical protein